MLQDIQDFKTLEAMKIGPCGMSSGPVLAGLLAEYDLCADGRDRMGKLQQRFASRPTNILQAVEVAQTYLPELLGVSGQDVVQLACSHGALLEVLRHHGHRVMGTAYAPMVWSDQPDVLRDGATGCATQRPDWPYRYIAESIDLPMTLHDTSAGELPFHDGSFDTLICDRTLGHFAYPEDWMGLVKEFCRVARSSVFIMLDKLPSNLATDAEYRGAFDRFRSEIADYDADGFACTVSFTRGDQVLGFKLTAA